MSYDYKGAKCVFTAVILGLCKHIYFICLPAEGFYFSFTSIFIGVFEQVQNIDTQRW